MKDLIRKVYFPFKISILKRISKRVASVSTRRAPTIAETLMLSFAWGNLGYSAGIGYLRRIVTLVRETDGPILECGSGGTTLLMACLTQWQGREIWVLEHHEGWYRYLRHIMHILDLQHVHLVYAPLQNHGDYEWYEHSKVIPEIPFSLVICDGPPGSTRGGRFGLVPEMGERLKENCIVLLDDTHRKQEKSIIEAWGEIRPIEVRNTGLLNTYTEVSFAG